MTRGDATRAASGARPAVGGRPAAIFAPGEAPEAKTLDVRDRKRRSFKETAR